jgi:hypothetical protein
MPHLTLGGPIPAYSLTTAHQLAESVWQSMSSPPRFSVTEIVCLWLSPTAPWGSWQRLWTHSLAAGKAAKSDKAASATVTARTS